MLTPDDAPAECVTGLADIAGIGFRISSRDEPAAAEELFMAGGATICLARCSG